MKTVFKDIYIYLVKLATICYISMVFILTLDYYNRSPDNRLLWLMGLSFIVLISYGYIKLFEPYNDIKGGNKNEL